MWKRAVSSVSTLPTTAHTTAERRVLSLLLRRQELSYRAASSSVRALSSWTQPATAAAASSSSARHAHVDPAVRPRRPQVNGQAVAFHVRDLLSPRAPPPPQSVPSSPEQSPRPYKSDLVVVLDMDECIIHSQFLSNPMAAQVMAHQLQNQRRNSSNNSETASVVDHFRVQLPDGGDLVHVNVRPGLTEFLQHITAHYETHIFTAAMPIYAQPVLDQLEHDGSVQFAARWYRDSCAWDPHRNAYVKDLSALTPLQGRLHRTVLVDNNPLSFLSHPSNGILVSSFYNDPTDTTLVAVQKLLAELEPHDDVRPHLERRFGLKEALEELGHQTTTQ